MLWAPSQAVESRGFNEVEADVLAKLGVLPRVEKALPFVAEGCGAVLAVGVGLCAGVPGGGEDERVFVATVLTWGWAPPESSVRTGKDAAQKGLASSFKSEIKESLMAGDQPSFSAWCC